MPQLTDEYALAAYVDGSDLHEVAPVLREQFQLLVLGRQWATTQVLFVDRLHDNDSELPDCLPNWELGINLGLDHIANSKAWFADIEALVTLLNELHQVSDRDFALFLAFRSRPCLQEHLWFIDGKPVDMVWLRAAIERLTKSKANGRKW